MYNEKKQTIRIVTAASLFDGHDVSINIMRRIMQSKGAEVIHLGHNRSAREIVETAIEEDAHAIAVTSYQGGHVEFFKYMKDMLNEAGCGHIKLFGGGGGTILPSEVEMLQQYGVEKIYTPDDGRSMGLEGMIDYLLHKCSIGNDYNEAYKKWNDEPPLNKSHDIRKIARDITFIEEEKTERCVVANPSNTLPETQVIIGITGTGGAGKSSVTDELVRRFLQTFSDKTIAIISVDPSRKKTGGALLGDRIRMNSISSPRVYMRSLATRNNDTALSVHIEEVIGVVKNAGYDFIIIESAGVGQSDSSMLPYCDVSLYVMTPEYGAASQLEKINWLDYADIICLNKFDKAGALDALNDVRKQYKRNHGLWNVSDEDLPITGTIAAQFNDEGINNLFGLLLKKNRNN